MLYSKPDVQQSLLGTILGFIAEGPGAQLFMLLMGVFFKPEKALKRALMLFIAAYVLNIFKFVIPLLLGLMPENLLAELKLPDDYNSGLFFLQIGDILQFAAIAYIILYLIHKLKHYQYWSIGLLIAIMILSPVLWDLKTNITLLDKAILLFNGHPPQTFFPVLPWLVYPLAGLSIGYFLKKQEPNKIIKKLGLIGAITIVISLGLPKTTTVTAWLPFYRTEAPDTIFHLGFVLGWLFLVQWITKKVRPNPFFTLLTFCSKNITAIYLIQWIMICWCLAFTGYMQLNLLNSIIWMLLVTANTLLLTYALNRFHARS